MTETANSIIRDAFDDIAALTSESPLEASDAQVGIRALNRIMATLAASGVNLGYTEVAKLNDTITVSAGASAGMVALLAMRLWPKYRSEEMSSAVVINARAAMKNLTYIARTSLTAQFPPTLPIGSGNEGDGWENTVFYPDTLEEIFTEAGGTIALEDNTDE